MTRSFRLSASLLFLTAALILPPGGASAQGGSLPVVERFEELADGMPPGWKNDSFGDVSVSFAADSRGAKEGSGAWRITVPAWQGGAARATYGGIPLRKDAAYSVEVWLRGRGVEAPVEVSLRKAGAAGKPYLARRFAVGPEWRRCVLEGKCPADDPAAALSLSLAGSGTVWVDALRAAEGDLPPREEAAPPPPVKGNLLYNSSFELGTHGWAGVGGVKLVGEGAQDGRQFARREGGALPLEGRPFRARPNQVYTFSAFLRSRVSGAKVELAAVELGDAFRAGQTFALSPEWKRYSFAAALPCREYARYFLLLRPAEGQSPFDVDAVQVEEGDLAEYAPAASLEVGIVLAGRSLFPRVYEFLTVPVRAWAREKTGEGASIRYRMEDFYGGTYAVGGEAVPSGQAVTEIPVKARVPLQGSVRVVVEGLVDEVVVSQDEAVLTVRPQEDAEPAGRSEKAEREFPAPGYHSWLGAEEQSRAAALELARRLVLERAGGSRAPLAVPDSPGKATAFDGALTKDASLFHPDGSGKPTLAVLRAAAAALGDAVPAGKVETAQLRAYVFGAGGDTVAALWSPGAVEQPRDLPVTLPPRQSRATDVMGNLTGFKNLGGKMALILRAEPIYLRVTGVAPEAVLAALKAARFAPAAGRVHRKDAEERRGRGESGK